MKKWAILLSLAVLLVVCLLFGVPAQAATFRSSQHTLTIHKGETVKDDLYGGGGNVRIEGKIDGDALLAGSTVTVDGEIRGDLIAAAGTVFVNGDIKDDVRVAGGTVYINGKIDGDLFAAGGQVFISDESRIGESAIVGSGTLEVSGPIEKNLMAGAGTVELNSRVGKNAKISSDNISLESDAKVMGNFLSIGSKKPKLVSGAELKGEVTHRYPPKEREAKAAGPFAGFVGFLFYLIFLFVSFLAALVTGLVIIGLIPKAVSESSRILKESFWASLGVGFVALIFVPIAAVILMVTLLGLPLGLISLGFYALFVYVSQIFFAIFLGETILKAITKQEEISSYWSLLLGLTILAVVSAIPFLGWLVKSVVILFGLGALVLAAFEALKRGRVTAPPVALPVAED